MPTKIDITGERYGRLTAVKYIGSNKGQGSLWLFRCDCGAYVVKMAGNVRHGNTRSCGCLRRELRAARNKAEATHGESKTRLYGVWHGMKERCTSPTHKDYPRYGAVGRTLCDEWKNSYEAFRDWSLANGYDPEAPYGKCTLDRIDNSKGYSPENCRWVDMSAQARNRRKGYEIYNLKGHTKKSR